MLPKNAICLGYVRLLFRGTVMKFIIFPKNRPNILGGLL